LQYEEIKIKDSDLQIKTTCGSGAGGQHRNRNKTAVQVYHKPSGMRIDNCEGKSQKHNKRKAKKLLKRKLEQAKNQSKRKQQDQKRKKQIGSGMRGDKIRTIQVLNNKVIDHRTGKKMRYSDYVKGHLEKLR